MFRILSVDNNVTRSNLTAKAVKDLKFGVRLNYALSATQAMLYIAGVRAARKILPDMIILSLPLPDAKELEALNALSDALQNDNVPIIVVAEEKKGKNGSVYYKNGACAFVTRGSDPEAYMSSIADTVTFVGMVEGLLPKQRRFFPPTGWTDPDIRDVLQVHL